MSRQLCLFILIILINDKHVQSSSHEQDHETSAVRTITSLVVSKRDDACPANDMCKSEWGFCGYGDKYCGKHCKTGPCTETHPKEKSTDTPDTEDKPKHIEPDHTKSSRKTTKPPTRKTKHPGPKTKRPGEKTKRPGKTTKKPGKTTKRPGKTTKRSGKTTKRPGEKTKRPGKTTKHPAKTTKRPGKTTKSPGGHGDGIITDSRFKCAFNNLDDHTRSQRLDGLKRSGWKPKNADEAAVFLAHVYHETDGLKVIKEYCAPGCGSNYASSWCDVQGVAGQLYYGRGWFQLSWPCNYHAAGKALGLDLLHHPDLVSEKQDVAVKTAVWFYQTNKMGGPAEKGDFAATTKIINGKLECNGGAGASHQTKRVDNYKRIRKCFNLGEPKINPTC